MERSRIKIYRKKMTLTVIHILFLIMVVAGISVMYFNANYGKGIKWIFDDSYEDSDTFSIQLGKDIEYIFSYVGYRDMFETDGELDMHKKIVGITDGPGRQEDYTLDWMVRYAKTRGYYLDENFVLQGIPTSMEEDEREVVIDYQMYNPRLPNDGFLENRMTMEELSLDILEHLGEYSFIYYNYIEKPANMRFRIVYCSDSGEETVYTNAPDMSLEEFKTTGKYVYIPGNTIKMETNLAAVPVNIAPLLEWWNPYDNDQNYMIISIDTTYPYQDAYAIEAKEYSDARSGFILGMQGVVTGIIGCFVTLVLLSILSGHVDENREEIHLYPVDELHTESYILLWAMGTAATLYLGRHLAMQLIGLFATESQMDYWKKVVKATILYGSMVLFLFGMLRRYKARAIWENSLAKRVKESFKDYLGHIPYAAGMCFCYLAFLCGNAAMMWGLLFLFVFSKDALSYRIMFYSFFVLAVGIDGLMFHYLFKKSIQRDLLDEAVSNISQGNTEYTVNLKRLSGKERSMGEHINNISSGLGTALKEQVKSERLKADLITNVSHDIKTPLTSIINYVDLLKREKISDPKIAGYLEVLDQKSQRLKTLTEDLVEASKASSGNVKLEMFDINLVELVQQTNGEFEERFAMRHLELVSSLPEAALIIRADGRRLWRVLENLYTNAFKYAMEHSRIYVDVEEKDGQAVFTMKNVSENPLNISADELTERFVRGDVARTTEGSGLGLSIAQSLTQIQGGTFHPEIDGDLFKATVMFPIRRCERREDRNALTNSADAGKTEEDGKEAESPAPEAEEEAALTAEEEKQERAQSV